MFFFGDIIQRQWLAIQYYFVANLLQEQVANVNKKSKQIFCKKKGKINMIKCNSVTLRFTYRVKKCIPQKGTFTRSLF